MTYELHSVLDFFPDFDTYRGFYSILTSLFLTFTTLANGYLKPTGKKPEVFDTAILIVTWLASILSVFTQIGVL